jgi:aspartyl protease family protein
MKFRLVLFGILIAGSAIGIAMPDMIGDRLADGDHEPVMVGANSPGPAAMALKDGAETSGWADTITLDRAADGHFYADVAVDGQSARMMVDTGASVIALTGADAATLGIAWDETEVSEVARGANGPVLGVLTNLPLVELGDFAAENVQALIIPEGLSVSLLGQSFLSKIGKVEIAADQMVMSS